MIIIKEEYIGKAVSNAKLGRVLVNDMIPSLYEYYSKNGFSHIFEEEIIEVIEEEIIEEVKPKSKKKKND